MSTSPPPTLFVLSTPIARPRPRRLGWRMAVLLLALPAAGQAHFTYQTNNGVLTLRSYTGPGGAVSIPSAVGGLPVTSIGLSAFLGRTNLTRITIPTSVTNLGSGAFQSCSQLSSVQGGEGITSVGTSAFFNCGSLTQVTLPPRVTTLGNSVFAYCANLASVALPASLTHLGSGVFNNCRSLTNITVDARNPAYSSVGGVLFDQGRATLLVYPAGLAGSYVIPDSVTRVGAAAFQGCINLTSVSIPIGVTSLESQAFASCPNLTTVSGGEGLTSVGQGAFSDCARLTQIELPQGLTSIGDSAFQDCIGLFQLTLPNSVTNIGNLAFQNCRFTSVTVPGSVVHLGTRPFQDCFALAAITVDPSNPAYSSVDGVLFDRAQTTLLEYPGGKEWDYTVPDGVTDIADGAFEDCAGPTRLTIPSSVLRIGDGAFQRSGVLVIGVDPLNPAYSSVGGVLFDKAQATLVFYPAGVGDTYTVPGSVTTIGAHAFEDCHGLRSITLDAGLTLIGANAFAGCFSLASVTLPEGLTSIGPSAFDACGTLSSVVIPGSVTNLGANAFAFCGRLQAIYFEGNAPSLGPYGVFVASQATVYYLAGSAGWGKTFGGRPTALWRPGGTFAVSVSTNGVGRVSGGGMLEGGRWQRVKATPGAGWRFADWTEAGQVVSSTPDYRFVLVKDRDLVAHFVANPFLALAGSYHGLMGDTNGVAPESAGSFTLTVTRQGGCSGVLLMGGVRYTLSGQFDVNGQLSALIPAGAPVLQVALQLDLSPGAERITGTVSPTSWTAAWAAQLAGDRAVFNARGFSATNYAGRYTLVLPGSADSNLAPGGDSWGTLRVDTAGMVHLSASLSDGTKLTQSSPLSREGVWALCAPLYGRRGLLQGWLGLTNTLTNDVCGCVEWIKPNTLGGTYYPAGFQLTAMASGSRYVPPPGNGALSLTNAELLLAGAGLEQMLTNSLTSTGQGGKLLSSTNHTRLTFNLATGAFAGSTRNPAGAVAPIRFSGVVLQKQNYAGGWFLGTNQSGSVYLGPE